MTGDIEAGWYDLGAMPGSVRSAWHRPLRAVSAYCGCCGCVKRYCNCTRCRCGCGRRK